MGDFNASTGADRNGYETYIGPYWSGFRNRYSDASNAAKELDHVLVGGRWGLLQNSRVFSSTQFLVADHKLVTTLERRLKSRGLTISKQARLQTGQFKDAMKAEEFADTLDRRLQGLAGSDNTKELWESLQGHCFGSSRKVLWS